MSQNLTFALVSNFSSCVDISIIDDAVLENDEAFLLESVGTSLVTAIPPSVTITIRNDDCELCDESSNTKTKFHSYFIQLLSLASLI